MSHCLNCGLEEGGKHRKLADVLLAEGSKPGFGLKKEALELEVHAHVAPEGSSDQGLVLVRIWEALAGEGGCGTRGVVREAAPSAFSPSPRAA